MQNVSAYVSQVMFFSREFFVTTQNLEIPAQLIQCCFTFEASRTMHWRCKVPGSIRAHYTMQNMLLSFNLAGEESPSLVTKINTTGSGILSPLVTQSVCESLTGIFSLQWPTSHTKVKSGPSAESSLIRGEFKSVVWEFLQ